MQEQDVFEHMNGLSHEEEELYARASREGGLTDEDRHRLEEIRVQLDQYYDLLHQRAARRNAGLDPSEAALRPPEVVEGYEQ